MDHWSWGFEMACPIRAQFRIGIPFRSRHRRDRLLVRAKVLPFWLGVSSSVVLEMRDLRVLVHRRSITALLRKTSLDISKKTFTLALEARLLSADMISASVAESQHT